MNTEALLNRVNRRISLIVERSQRFFPSGCDLSMLKEGKRLRAETFLQFSQDESERSVKIAAAIELLHAATLIHDDILDRSRLRRGQPALHTRYGISAGLLYGDYLFSAAFTMIAELGDPRIYRRMTRALERLLRGEMIENFRRCDTSLSKEDYMWIIRRKSGALFALACSLGAMVNKASEKTTRACHEFGLNAGMAYQVMDDYLDYFGGDEGKEKFTDFKQGIVTLPLIYLLEKGSPAERKAISRSLNDGEAGGNEVQQIEFLMNFYGIPALVSKDIALLIENAELLLPGTFLRDRKGRFCILDWMKGRIEYGRKEYSDSGRGIRGN